MLLSYILLFAAYNLMRLHGAALESNRRTSPSPPLLPPSTSVATTLEQNNDFACSFLRTSLSTSSGSPWGVSCSAEKKYQRKKNTKMISYYGNYFSGSSCSRGTLLVPRSYGGGQLEQRPPWTQNLCPRLGPQRTPADDGVR